MEFTNIGKHCKTCNQYDFLPFKCDLCSNFFCLNHKTPESHNCIFRQIPEKKNIVLPKIKKYK